MLDSNMVESGSGDCGRSILLLRIDRFLLTRQGLGAYELMYSDGRLGSAIEATFTTAIE